MKTFYVGTILAGPTVLVRCKYPYQAAERYLQCNTRNTPPKVVWVSSPKHHHWLFKVCRPGHPFFLAPVYLHDWEEYK